jgi:hypothetical protein
MIGGIVDIGHLYQTPQKDTIIIERIREFLRFWRLTMSRKIMLKKKIPFLLGKRNLPVMQLSQHPYQTMKLSRLKHDVAALHSSATIGHRRVKPTHTTVVAGHPFVAALIFGAVVRGSSGT